MIAFWKIRSQVTFNSSKQQQREGTTIENRCLSTGYVEICVELGSDQGFIRTQTVTWHHMMEKQQSLVLLVSSYLGSNCVQNESSAYLISHDIELDHYAHRKFILVLFD